MTKEEQITSIIAKLDVDIKDESKILMADFFRSIQDQPLFDKMLDLLTRFPSVLDNFAKCFQDKIGFFKNKGTDVDWQGIVDKEKQAIKSIE
ncbi:hypothetical protein HY932_00095 [Candidatus Falkowbacteria bacterium]|nr:hypothetical protein [Candidatus Falkowbacteria bacterium]